MRVTEFCVDFSDRNERLEREFEIVYKPSGSLEVIINMCVSYFLNSNEIYVPQIILGIKVYVHDLNLLDWLHLLFTMIDVI